MKKIVASLCFATGFLVSGCGDGNGSKSAEKFTLPAPGTVIDSAGMKIKDPLNDFVFTVTLLADSLVKDGVYDVRAAYGYDVAEGRFTMPKGLERYRLAIRKSDTPYTYVIGFLTPKDTTFYEYFEVRGKKNAIGMQYLKAYTFE